MVTIAKNQLQRDESITQQPVLSPVHTVAEKCDCTVARKWDCRRKVRLSQKSETVAEPKVRLSPNFVQQSHFRATVSLLCDSLTFLPQCGQGFTVKVVCLAKKMHGGW